MQALPEMKHVRAAWVDPSSSSGYVFPRMHLRANGLSLDKALSSEKFFGSAANACRAVVSNEADLCACFLSVAADRAAAQLEVEKTFGHPADHLRVLSVTERIPPDGLVVGAHVDRESQSRIARSLLGMHQQAAGRSALRTLLQAERLMPPNESVLRELDRLRLL